MRRERPRCDDRRRPLGAERSVARDAARAQPALEKRGAIAGHVSAPRCRNDERNRRQPVADVGDPDVAVALDVHLSVLADVSHVGVVRDEGQSARPARTMRARPRRCATTERSPSAPIDEARAISPFRRRLSVCTPSLGRATSRTTSVTRTPSTTRAPATRAQSSRIASSTSRRTDSPRSRSRESRGCARNRRRSRRRWARARGHPGERRRARPSTRSSAPMSARMRDASGLRYSAHGFGRGKRARSTTSTSTPARASAKASDEPAGPPPTTRTSAFTRQRANLRTP